MLGKFWVWPNRSAFLMSMFMRGKSFRGSTNMCYSKISSLRRVPLTFSRKCLSVGFFLEKELTYYRRKFRSQTSENMDRWKSTGGKSLRREEKRRRKKIREGRVRGKKIQAREKVEKKSRNTVFYQ